jgi:tetratricopeptide (TPR) repeat protein
MPAGWRTIVTAACRALSEAMLVMALPSLVLPGNACGQQSSEPDSRVQELYAQAQAAKNRGDLTTAIDKYRSLLALAPTLAPAYNNLGMLYLETRDYAKAAETFEAGLKQDPSMSSSLVLLGISYFQLRDYARAQPVLEKALRVLPKDEQAQMYLGLCLFKTGQLEAGAAVLQRLAKQSPNNLDALYSLGQLYMALAQETLHKLQTMAPDSYLTHLVTGEMEEKMEHYDAAVTQYKQAIERQPPGYVGLHYKLGNAYWLNGKWQEAIAAFKEELAVDPRNCMALWKVGNIMVSNKQDPSEALSYLSRSIEICPNLVQAMVDKARLLSDKGDYEAAVLLYKRAVELDPQEATIHYQLAMTYRKLQRMPDAKAEMAIVQKLNERQK